MSLTVPAIDLSSPDAPIAIEVQSLAHPDTLIDCLPTCRSEHAPEPVIAGEWFERKMSAIAVAGQP